MTARRPLSPTAKAKVFLDAGGVCHICGQKIRAQHGEAWDAEHVIPLALGGKDEPENMRPAHKACHSEKTRADNTQWTKAKRQQLRHLGIRKAKRLIEGSRGTRFKRKVSGEVVLR